MQLYYCSDNKTSAPRDTTSKQKQIVTIKQITVLYLITVSCSAERSKLATSYEVVRSILLYRYTTGAQQETEMDINLL